MEQEKSFAVEDLDAVTYQEHKITEAYAFKRNMFFVPTNEFAIYRAALKGVVRWGASDESYLAAASSPDDLAAEEELKKGLKDQPGMTTSQIWEHLHLSEEWDAYVKGRRTGDLSFNLPIFRAFYRLKRKTDLVTCGRNPGTFKEPLYILKENIGIKVGKKTCYIHSSKARLLDQGAGPDSEEVRLISPMDILVRDQTWLKTFFEYSYTFEYFKKKGMKWPLSILVGNRFVGYFDCKMEWRTRRFLIKEKNIFDSAFHGHKGIGLALQDLAAFHGAEDIVEKR